MLRNKKLRIAIFMFAAVSAASAQVLAPAEIEEPGCRSLQQRYFAH